jgi:hypothetical protein
MGYAMKNICGLKYSRLCSRNSKKHEIYPLDYAKSQIKIQQNMQLG